MSAEDLVEASFELPSGRLSLTPEEKMGIIGAAVYLPHGPLVASDIIDMDEATPNKQWVDTSGDASPSGMWYYQVTAYNNRCRAEGPF